MFNLRKMAMKLYKYKSKHNKNYTYSDAKHEVKQHIINKINKFNSVVDLSHIDKNKIPKIIHLTCKDKNHLDNEVWESCLKKYKEMYPDYKIIVYDNNDIYNIIEQFDNKNIDKIRSIKIGAILADIFRYLILYLRGGYYSDLDCEPIKRIENLTDTQYHGNSSNEFFIYPTSKKIINSSCEFYETPCNNYVIIGKNKETNIFKCKCLGHNYIKDKTEIILCYEFEKTWHRDLINNVTIKNKWTDNNVGICQWFIAAKPQHKLFLKCYNNSVKNIRRLVNLSKQNKDYHYRVLNLCGPLFFTKIINKLLYIDDNLNETITFLQSDYFCAGSGEKVPYTKNTFIKHHFTGSWL